MTVLRIPPLPGGRARIQLVDAAEGTPVLGFDGPEWATAYEALALDTEQQVELAPTADIATAGGGATAYLVTVTASGGRSARHLVQMQDSLNIQELADLIAAAAIPAADILAGRVIPAGGATSQVLAKASGAHYDTHWVDPATGGAMGGANLSIAAKTAETLNVASDSGDDATVPAATDSYAGLMTAAEHVKLGGIEAAATAAGAAGDAFASGHLSALDPHPEYVLESALGSASYTAATDYDPAGAAAAVTVESLGAVPTSRTINGIPLSADITVDAQGGFSSSYLFCDHVEFAGTTPPWHELERQSDGGSGVGHTLATGTGIYIELDRYVTGPLGTTLIPGGNWNFTLFAKGDLASRSFQLRGQVYRVDSAGAIVGSVLGTAETSVLANTTPVGLPASCFVAEQAGWDPTDRVGIVISGKRLQNGGTLTWYHDYASGWASAVQTPITLLHNQMNGLNDGDYMHLTRAQYEALLVLLGS